MTPTEDELTRLRFLVRVVQRESAHLAITDQRLFNQPFSLERARSLSEDVDLAERVEAFVARFGRLQDTLADKLLPAFLRALGESTGAVIDNLDRAERLSWLDSADEWMATRRLRNQMIHEYIDDPAILASALQAGHERVPMLRHMGESLLAELMQRGWLATSTIR